MELSLRRWRPGQLLLSWAAYWAGLVGVTLGPAISASWRATQLPDAHGSIAAGFNNGMLTYTVMENGVQTWVGSTPFSTAILWLVGPPLLLWVVWLLARERSVSGRPAFAASPPPLDALPRPAADEWEPRHDERIGVERGRVRTPDPSA